MVLLSVKALYGLTAIFAIQLVYLTYSKIIDKFYENNPATAIPLNKLGLFGVMGLMMIAYMILISLCVLLICAILQAMFSSPNSPSTAGGTAGGGTPEVAQPQLAIIPPPTPQVLQPPQLSSGQVTSEPPQAPQLSSGQVTSEPPQAPQLSSGQVTNETLQARELPQHPSGQVANGDIVPPAEPRQVQQKPNIQTNNKNTASYDIGPTALRFASVLMGQGQGGGKQKRAARAKKMTGGNMPNMNDAMAAGAKLAADTGLMAGPPGAPPVDMTAPTTETQETVREAPRESKIDMVLNIINAYYSFLMSFDHFHFIGLLVLFSLFQFILFICFAAALYSTDKDDLKNVNYGHSLLLWYTGAFTAGYFVILYYL